MHVFIVYAHPSADSFTFHAKNAFVDGLIAAGHTHETSDLYAMGFRTDISEAEYIREAYYKNGEIVGDDILREQEKINRSDAIAFIYPVFWTEAPAKLVGWFDRVWTYGFAYGEQRTMKTLEKALFLCSAGNTRAYLEEHGLLNAMERVMVRDRIFDRAKSCEFIVLEGTSRGVATRRTLWDKNLKAAFEAGRNLAAT